MRMKQRQDLPTWLYLWLPLGMLLVPYGLTIGSPSLAEAYFAKERGLAENLTAVWLFIALYFSLKCVAIHGQSGLTGRARWLLRSWLIAYLLGVLYFLGEEISWGQHLFDWETPDFWARINDQQETNLHNTFGIFDQVPRALVTLFIIFGGLFVPVVVRMRQQAIEDRQIAYWILPTFTLIPSSLAVLLVSVHDKPYRLLDMSIPAAFDFKDGEVKELLIALTMMVYIVSVNRRLRH